MNIRTPDVRRTAEFYAKLFSTQVSRAENAFASAGSRRGELWFVRLGQSSLALSPAAPGEKPGIDHFCFRVEGFNRDAMKQKVAGFNLQIDRTDPPGNNLWTKDPDGHLIQFSAPQNPTRPPGAGVDGVLVKAPDSEAGTSISAETNQATHARGAEVRTLGRLLPENPG